VGCADAGASPTATPKDVAARSNVVITMLPSSPHVREVYLGAQGLLQTVRPDSLLIDCSTVGPATAREVAAATIAKKALAADAPVSGGACARVCRPACIAQRREGRGPGVGGAEAGTLTFMVGGPKATFDRAKPVLEKMGKNVVHCGDAGTGQARPPPQHRLCAHPS
jgi:3-hydroxyisobutyrate dehydrogenase